MRNFIILSIVSLFFSCDYCPKGKKGIPVYTELPPISDSTKALVPYKNGEVVKLKHNKGKIVLFSVQRIISKAQSSCEDCCENISYVKYEEDNTVLIPDYPVFQISFTISNLYNSSSGIFSNVSERIQFNKKLDTILVNNIIYNDVIKLGNGYSNQAEVDSLYFSKSKGIVKLILKNGEYYETEL